MYTYAAGSPGTFGALGTKVTLRPEDIARMERQRQDPNYMIPLLEAQLTQQLQKLAKEEATDSAVNPSRGNNIAVWKRESAKTRAEIVVWKRKQGDVPTPLERSLDPQKRAALPVWVWPVALSVSAFVLWQLVRKR